MEMSKLGRATCDLLSLEEALGNFRQAWKESVAHLTSAPRGRKTEAAVTRAWKKAQDRLTQLGNRLGDLPMREETFGEDWTWFHTKADQIGEVLEELEALVELQSTQLWHAKGRQERGPATTEGKPPWVYQVA